VKHASMRAAAFFGAVYELVELLTGEAPSHQAQRLIRSYLEDAGDVGLSERGLYAVSRYTQAQLPSLEAVLRKPSGSELSRTESLIRRIHEEAVKLRQEYGR
jgi:hypothetical protein